MLIKYSQNYNFFVFYFVSIEVGTAALKIFSVMIPSLVDTSLDFSLFRVVGPYGLTNPNVSPIIGIGTAEEVILVGFFFSFFQDLA